MFLTESEAAARLKVDRRTLRKLIRAGRLNACDVGSGKRRHFRIAPESLAEIANTPEQWSPPAQSRRLIRRPRPHQMQGGGLMRHFPTA